MIEFHEALRILQEKTPSPETVLHLPFGDALGHVLAQEIRADADAPPFDRSMMDGYALRSSDAVAAPAELKIVGESKAGKPFSGVIGPGQCISILTGAVLPQGADAVIPIEKIKSGDRTIRFEAPVAAGMNVAHKGEDVRAGQRLLGPGAKIRPQEIPILAACGADVVSVFPSPIVSILPTGDELVPPSQQPKLGQIRESNSFALEAQVRRRGFTARRFAPAPDDPVRLHREMTRAFEEGDCLLVSGGISVGRYDYVAKVFQELGIEQHFHGVAVKPGKPVWFGTKGKKAVFGLPGNPVSSFVIFELFVRPVLERMAGAEFHFPARWGRLGEGTLRKNPRVQWVPARLEEKEEGAILHPIEWTSSGDFYELTKAQALLEIPAETMPHAGSRVRFLCLE